MSEMVDYYTLLGCSQNSSYEELKKSYQELVLKHHPDKFASAPAPDRSSERFQEITEAWHTLRDAEKRKAYDAHLLAELCKSENLVYAKLSWSELELNSNGEFTYPCRCGSMYSVSNDTQQEETVFVSCVECSFGILISDKCK